MLFPSDGNQDCSACSAPLYDRSLGSEAYSTIAFNLLPFLLTFIIISILVLYKLFPLLADQQSLSKDELYLPSDAPSTLRVQHAVHGNRKLRRKFAAISFSTTIALSTVLMELILCEISDTLNRSARTFALQTTVPSLLFLLVILIPFLEIQSIVKGIAGSLSNSASDTGRIPKLPWLLQVLGFGIWLLSFWYIGEALPGPRTELLTLKNLSNLCLERIGVIGICLMALLSGFASISSPWQTFGARSRPVTEGDLARKQAGLNATNDMLGVKQSRLRALEHRLSSAPKESYMKKALNTVRGNADQLEMRSLKLEISGLETMSTSLSSNLSMLQTRRNAALHSQTPLGKAMILPNYLFSIYCLYRIPTITYTAFHRYTSTKNKTPNFSTSDPVTRFLGLLATHWDPLLDTAAWSHQISFFLTGLILLLSFNSVLQTFYLFTRWTPSLLYQAQANLALIVAQVCATYVVASALLLRSNLPKEVGSVISEALGTPMDIRFADRWFEAWFLAGALATVLGIFLGRRFGGSGDAFEKDEWDDLGEVELGHKRS